jgi:hypothetical protein
MRLIWKKDWTLLILLFLIFRLIYTGIGLVVAMGPSPIPQASGAEYDSTIPLLHLDKLSQALVNVWYRWDTGWYLQIAAFGYISGSGNIAFMPLYSWLIRGFVFLTNDYLFSALVISNLAALAVFFLLYEVANMEGLGSSDSMKAVLFMAFFPTAFFLFAAYTESIFIALVLGLWLAARRKAWLLAGLLGGLATLRRLDPALSLYSIVTIAVLFSRGTPPTLLMSFSRYLLVLFPAFLLLGKIHKRSFRLAIWAPSICLQVLMLYGFLQWRFIA